MPNDRLYTGFRVGFSWLGLYGLAACVVFKSWMLTVESILLVGHPWSFYCESYAHSVKRTASRYNQRDTFAGRGTRSIYPFGDQESSRSVQVVFVGRVSQATVGGRLKGVQIWCSQFDGASLVRFNSASSSRTPHTFSLVRRILLNNTNVGFSTL